MSGRVSLIPSVKQSIDGNEFFAHTARSRCFGVSEDDNSLVAFLDQLL